MGNRFWEKRKYIIQKYLSAILIIFIVVLLLVVIGLSLLVFSTSDVDKDYLWTTEECRTKCNKKGFDRQPLVVISLDGFKRSYVERRIVKTLEHMAKCGTTAEYLYPSFPSKTFPNHYTIATGLYPESHGIVDNAVYDKRFSSKLVDVRRTKDERYFEGIPIWNVLERQNITTACLFWAGCDLPINGMQPSYNIKYNRSMAYRDRIDQILTWLTMPVEKRPTLIMSYFNQPDLVGHFHSSETEVDKELENIDSVLNYLFRSLYENGLLNCVNVIILSDHGMQKLDHRYYLDELVDAGNSTLYARGVIGRIHFLNRTDSSLKVKESMEKLACINTSHFRQYDRSGIPKRYHFSATDKVGDLIFEGQLGTIFFENRASDYSIGYDHGYDFILPPMWTIFYARGPNIVPGLIVKPFQNIEVFNLMAALLRLDADVPPNNGTVGRLNSMLTNISVKKPTRIKPLKECMINRTPDAEKSCTFGALSLLSGNEQFCYIARCSADYLSSASILSSDSNRTIALIERYNYEVSEPKKSRKKRQLEQVITTNFSAQGSSGLNVELYGDTAGHFVNLQNLTLQYVKIYGELVVVSGRIYDFDHNGIADQVTSSKLHRDPTIVSHIFWVIFQCNGSQWLPDKFECKEPKSLRALPFILPNLARDYNCLDSMAFLTTNTARLRDIELATGLEFFPTSWTPNQELYDDDFSIVLRTTMPERLWPMKEGNERQ